MLNRAQIVLTLTAALLCVTGCDDEPSPERCEKSACKALGLAYMNGEGDRARDPDKAIAYFNAACQRGDSDSCLELSVRYIQGEHVEPDQRVALDYLDKACALEDDTACGLHDELHAVLEARRDATRFAARCQEAPGDGACIEAARRHLTGGPVPKQPERATELLQRGCDAGAARACLDLAAMAMLGEAIPADPARAVALYEAACEADSNEGCELAGKALKDGVGGETDLERASGYLQRACDGGESPESCTILAVMTLKGDRGEPDLEASLPLFERGCDGDVVLACATLGNLYYKGEGMARDVPKAQRFLGRACTLGEKPACAMAKTLE